MKVLDHSAARLVECRRKLVRITRRLAQAVRDVTKVTECAREMSLLDRTIEVRRSPTPHDVDEVLHVPVFTLKRLDDLSIAIDDRRRRVRRHDDASSFAVYDVPDAHAAVPIHARGIAVGAGISTRARHS